MEQNCIFGYRERERIGTMEQRKDKNRSIRLERTTFKMLRNSGHTYRNFKRNFEIPERKIRTLVGSLLG